MKKEIEFIIADSDYEDDCESLDVDIPTKCPYCHTGIIPVVLGSYCSGKENNRHLIISLFCPVCENLFTAIYDSSLLPDNYQLYPMELNPTSIDKAIETLSPYFCKIYAESEKAEEQGLYQIAGLGYRKAIEFLVKDYVIAKNSDLESTIKSESLSQSIKRIEDNRIKVLAERSTWIGNDEAHYVKKHETLDVSHMKRFIHALLRFIEAEFALEEAMAIEYKK